jgi:hypothetical protein
MRNNDKTLTIDCGCYKSTFDMILSPKVGLLAYDQHGVFSWAGGLRKRGGGDDDEETQVAARVDVWGKISMGEAWVRCS